MGYAYGLKGAPSVGGGLPGLPQRATSIGTDPAGAPLQTVLLRASALFLTPAWATYARVTAQGRGGRGLRNPASGGAHGGAGGGLAASTIDAVSPSTPIEITFGTAATLANFSGYQLSGGYGGDATTSAGGAPGVGSGGAINFNGGAGATVSGGVGAGGGAAGRGGNGAEGTGNGTSSIGGNSGPGDVLVTGGGAGGSGKDDTGLFTGALSRTDASSLGAVVVGKSTVPPTNPAGTPLTADGGDGGGGSGGVKNGESNSPGQAWVLIELW